MTPKEHAETVDFYRRPGIFTDVAALTTAIGNGNYPGLRRRYQTEEALRLPSELLRDLREKDKTGGTGKNPLAP